jgi:hypothetical protein
MDQPRVSLEPKDLDPPARKLRDALEDQLSSALSAAVERTRREYAGEDLDTVYRTLLEHTREGLHPDIAEGFDPDRHDLRVVAAEVIRQAGR